MPRVCQNAYNIEDAEYKLNQHESKATPKAF